MLISHCMKICWVDQVLRHKNYCTFAGQLQKESTELNLRLITGYISGIYWGFLTESIRNKESESLENIVWNALQKQAAVNNKRICSIAIREFFSLRRHTIICIQYGNHRLHHKVLL